MKDITFRGWLEKLAQEITPGRIGKELEVSGPPITEKIKAVRQKLRPLGRLAQQRNILAGKPSGYIPPESS